MNATGISQVLTVGMEGKEKQERREWSMWYLIKVGSISTNSCLVWYRYGYTYIYTHIYANFIDICMYEG